MKKSENNKNIPPIEDIDKDLDQILSILETIDNINLDGDIDVKNISNKIHKSIEVMSEKYKPLMDDLEDGQKE